MGVIIPAQYLSQVQAAATKLGIPVAVVGEQLATESSWNPNAVSPAGAQGLAQFEPGTWAQYGHGSPFNADDAITAYTAYMAALLHQEGGDVRKALAAYNAGPGNLAAGYGYADGILKQAGANDIHSSGGGGIGSVVSGIESAAGGLISWPSDIVGFFSKATDDLAALGQWFGAFTRPSTWVRVGAGALGVLLLIFGIVCFGREAGRTTP